MYSRILSIFMSSDNRDGTTIRFFFHLNNQTSLVLMKREVLVFKVFGSDLHEVSHFNSRISALVFTFCYRLLDAKKFSMNPSQFKWVTRETRYSLSITIRNLKSQVTELVQRPTTMLKTLYFSRGNQFFQISPGIKSLYDRVRKVFYLLARET